MDQSERLAYLTTAFLEDSMYDGEIEPGETDEERKVLLRSLMNVRMPRRMKPEILKVQDEYLQERLRQTGIVQVSDLPVIREEGSTLPWGDTISLWQGDITTLACDAVVNAANSEMLGCFIAMHSCIDNCIHTYAGIQLRAECARKMRELRSRYGGDYVQPTALPLLTDAYNLPSRKVIHIVGPAVEKDVTPALAEELAACYRNVLDLCLENSLRTVAFCCISTGVFRFPNHLAAKIAVQTVSAWLDEHPDGIGRVIFNVFKDADRYFYEGELGIGKRR